MSCETFSRQTMTTTTIVVNRFLDSDIFWVQFFFFERVIPLKPDELCLKLIKFHMLKLTSFDEHFQL